MTSTNRDAALPQALGRLRVALEDAYMRASRDLGLTSQQAELLCAALSPTAIGPLAAALRCDRSNVSRLVDRGSARGLLRRRAQEDDARVTLVALTPAGEAAAHQFLAALEALSSGLRASWSGDRQRLAVDLLNEIADALDSQRPAPAGRRRKRSHVG